MFCQYKNVFGAPHTGNHSYRIFDVAIIDVVLTILLGLIIYWIVKNYFNISVDYMFGYILLILFVLSIIAHRMFCVRTTVDKLLFPD